MIKAILKIRAIIMRGLFPARNYFLFDNKVRTTKPISGKFGYDRGTPIDRYYIEKFLEDNKKFIKGRVLEITDNSYTLKFGGKNVKKSDVLDINPKNQKANIISDLRNLSNLRNDTYDCIILTHVLGLIDDKESALKEVGRVLNPGGTLLFTGSCLGPIVENNDVYWRFTGRSVKYLMKKFIKPKKLLVNTYGNALAGQAFFVGMSQEDLSQKELEYNDKRFPCVVSAVAVK